MPLRERVIHEIVSLDPRAAAQRALSVVIAFARARGGAVFALEERRPGLVASSGIAEDDLVRVRTASTSSRSALEAGEAVHDGESTIVPLLRAVTRDLVGILYITGADRPETLSHLPGEVGLVLSATVAAILEPRVLSPSIQGYLASNSPEDVEKHRLQIVLQRFGWNVMRAAAAMGVSRSTMYARMIRLGVSRERPHRGGRPPKPIGGEEL